MEESEENLIQTHGCMDMLSLNNQLFQKRLFNHLLQRVLSKSNLRNMNNTVHPSLSKKLDRGLLGNYNQLESVLEYNLLLVLLKQTVLKKNPNSNLGNYSNGQPT